MTIYIHHFNVFSSGNSVINMASPRSRLYALLVAINNYEPPVTPLRGCVNDLHKVAAYLDAEAKDFEIHIRKLIDHEATKDNIVKAFSSHFHPATSNDVVLFYFSGHGTQEDAGEIFWPAEHDRRFESLVCYDGYTRSGGSAKVTLLADKELRYLIGKLADKGAHIVTIFDCCHSGGNTKNGFFAREGEVLERRMICQDKPSHAFPARAWKDFIFSESISFDDVKKSPIDQFLPEGKHIQLAACQSDESAFEVGGAGMFTKNLLEVLARSSGCITYYDLQARIQNYMRYQFKQTPKAYVVGENESSLFRGFLNKQGESKPQYGNVSFNQSNGWVIDLGAMHGLSSDSMVTILDGNKDRQYSAKVSDVYATHAILQPDSNSDLDQNLSYKGQSTDYFFITLRIFIAVRDALIKEDLEKKLTASSAFKIGEAREQADYCIEQKQAEIFISRPEKIGVPIIQPVDHSHENSTVIVRNYLEHLSQFEFVKQLQNPNAFLFNKFPVEIFFYQKNALQVEEPIQVRGGEIVPAFTKQEGNKPGGSIRIKLKNMSDQKLYCALLYLTFNFEVYLKLLKEVVVSLNPNEECWARDGASIPLMLEEEIVCYNYQESASTLKLIVSTSDFTQQIVRFEMPPLPSPLDPGKKGLTLSTNAYIPGVEDWITQSFDIKVRNPDFTV